MGNVTLWCWIEIEVAVPKTNIQWLWDHHTCIIPFLEGNSTIESLKPDLLISNLNRTNSSSGDLNRVSYNDLCFPKISNYGSMKKKKHNVGVSTDNTMKMNG